MRVIDGGCTRSHVGQLARRARPAGAQHRQHGELAGRDVVGTELLAQSAGQLHHRDPEVRGNGGTGDHRHIVSIPHYFC